MNSGVEQDRGRGGARPRVVLQFYGCNELGHIQRFCPAASGSRGGRGGFGTNRKRIRSVAELDTETSGKGKKMARMGNEWGEK